MARENGNPDQSVDVAEPIGILEIAIDSEEEANARRELNDVVHKMLLLGLILSTAILFAGLALSGIKHQPIPSHVSDFSALYQGLKTLSPPSVLSLGILLLIATPVLRVFGSLVEFVLKRDWHFALITAVVLGILGISLFYGQG